MFIGAKKKSKGIMSCSTYVLTMPAEADMDATKWFFLNEEINILHSIDVFNFAKVENVSDGKIYYVDKAFITTFPKEPEQAISLTLLGGNNSGYDASAY